MKEIINTYKNACGFSLAEMLATLAIGAIILVAVLGVYNRALSASAAITEKIDRSKLPSEVIQRIAEDLDNIMTSGLDTTINIQNKTELGYQSAKMVIEKSFYDNKNEKQTFEKIVWQTSYDYESNTPGLILYRSYSGMALEDKLLDKQKEDWEREFFIPLTNGVTLFNIQAVKNDKPQDNWQSNSLPNAVIVTISFAEPFEMLNGNLVVPDTEKTKRTIAIDRTRRIAFGYVTNFDRDFDDINDVNDVNDSKANPQDANNPDDNFTIRDTRRR